MAPEALFDLAVNRAATLLLGLGLRDVGSPVAQAALAEWHARTRFARRVPLPEVTRCLELRPAGSGWHWLGGPAGTWQPGRAAFP